MRAKKFLPASISATITRGVFAGILLLCMAAATSAYTVVLRDGRRLEVPSVFVVTKTTFTYELAPGINKTMLLVLIDVAATEKINNESPGGFFNHGAAANASVAAPLPRKAQRTLSNRDLESIKDRRLQSERQYERRRVELGLPSIEETRRRQAQEEEILLERSRAQALSQAENEAYWRDRAASLRRELLTIDAQINYLRARLASLQQFPLATHSLVTSVLPFVPLGTTSAVVPPPLPNPGIFVSPRTGLDRQRGQLPIGSAPMRFDAPRLARPVIGFGFPLGVASGFGFPLRPFDYVEDSYERANLSDRLNDLLIARAGLSALWKQLEDEARDAKVPQIWLEP